MHTHLKPGHKAQTTSFRGTVTPSTSEAFRLQCEISVNRHFADTHIAEARRKLRLIGLYKEIALSTDSPAIDGQAEKLEHRLKVDLQNYVACQKRIENLTALQPGA